MGEEVKNKGILPENEVRSLLSTTFDNNHIYAYISFRNFKGIEPAIENIQCVHKILQEMGIKAINLEAIKEMFEKAIPRKEYLVASGTPAIDGRDAEMLYYFISDKSAPLFRENENGKVNYRELELIENVEAGQLLAEIIPASEGSPGFDVFGKPVKQKSGKKEKLKVGKNVTLSEDGLQAFAASGGYVFMVGDKIEIEQVLKVSGDVDFSIGNIYFKGDVEIAGSVLEGFKVQAEGNIVVKQNVERASIIADGNIEIFGNVFGKEDAIIKAGRNVTLKFIENGRIEAGGNVVISNHALNTKIDSKRQILVKSNNKKALIGGRIRSCMGIETTFAGSETANIKTILEIYVDEELLESIKETKEKMAIENSLDKIEELKKRLESLNNEIDIMKKSEIIITGEAYTGVGIIINNYEHPLNRDLTKVCFYLDENNKIVQKDVR